MDKSTLSNYGWIVIAVLVLAVIIALATPFGNYVKLGAESTLFGLINMKTDSDVQSVVNQGLSEYGWSVRVLNDTQIEYGEILSTINNQDVKNLAYTFYNCKNIIIAPEIPETIVCMEGTFNACTKLTTAPSKIPANVTNMAGTFALCWELTGTITIDANPLAYDDCLQTYDNGKDIILTGKSTILNEIASTSRNSNRVTIQ